MYSGEKKRSMRGWYLKRIRFLPLPVMTSGYFVLLLAVENVERIRPALVLPPLFFALVSTAAVFFLLAAAFRSAARAALVGMSLSVMIMGFLQALLLFQGAIENVVFVLWWTATFLLIILWLSIADRDLTLPARLLTWVFGFLFFGNLLYAGWSFAMRANAPPIQTPRVEAGAVREPLRDIYYLIFDRYPNRATLLDYYDFDNEPFLEYLTGKGFYVTDESYANYPKTAYSMASTLNLMHLEELTEKLGRESDDWTPMFELTRRHEAGRFLKSQGYQYVHSGSWWQGTRGSPLADREYHVGGLSEFSKRLMDCSLLYPLGIMTGLYDLRMQHWEGIHFQFDLLESLEPDRPTFVLAHLLIPHPPYVMDRDGSYVSLSQEEERNRRENYLNQLIYTNHRLERLFDSLLQRYENSGRPLPIILLQSDEGPYPVRYEASEADFNWRYATTDELREKFGILNAYFLPERTPEVLHPSFSPVNSFRLVFNLYFGTELELLPDRSYAFTDYQRLYDFFDVTDRLKATASERSQASD